MMSTLLRLDTISFWYNALHSPIDLKIKKARVYSDTYRYNHFHNISGK